MCPVSTEYKELVKTQPHQAANIYGLARQESTLASGLIIAGGLWRTWKLLTKNGSTTLREQLIEARIVVFVHDTVE